MSFNAKSSVSSFCMLLFATYVALACKWMYQTCVKSIPPIPDEISEQCEGGDFRKFNKPFHVTLFYSIAKVGLLIAYKVEKWWKSGRIREPGQPKFGMFLLPACADVFSTMSFTLSLSMLDAGLWQMLGSSRIVFTAVFSTVFFGKRLLLYKWVSCLVCLFGLCFVASTCFLDSKTPAKESTSGNQTVVGVICALLGGALASFQVCFEERLLTTYNVPAKKILGAEGVWGCIIMGVLLLALNLVPGDDHGSFESSADLWYMFTNSTMLFSLVCTMIPMQALYNYSGLFITKHISAVSRVLVDASSTMSIWLVQIFIGWYFAGSSYGEKWKAHSYLQLVGFVFLVFGTLAYNGIIKLRGFRYEEVLAPEAQQLMNIT